MEAQDLSGQEKESLAGDVMESLGESRESGNDVATRSQEQHEDGGEQDDLPQGVKERLGRQEKRHQREMRQMRQQMEALHSRISQPNFQEQSPEMNPYDMQGGAPQTPQGGNVGEQIQQAVSYALQHKDMQERKAKEAEDLAHLHRQKQALHEHLNSMGDKYDDFHDAVFAHDVPITPHMAEFAVTLPRSGPGSAGEVFYKLAKNKPELERISKLRPVDQLSEMVKLSHALIAGGNDSKGASGNSLNNRAIGNIKNNPVTNSHSISDKTPVSELRQRMKTNWK